MARLGEADPRVRANAIESLWGSGLAGSSPAVEFRGQRRQNPGSGQRAARALPPGESSVLADVVKLAGHESALFRASAAWVMGEASDPRFTEALRRMISDPDAIVRKRVFAGLAQIKAANAQSPVGEKWHVAGRMLAGESPKGLRRLMLAVAGQDMRAQPKVAPLQFLLSEGAQYVTSYKVTEKPLPESMSVVFVIPRSRDAADGPLFH